MINVKSESDGSITLSVNIKLKGSFLEMEERIQNSVNEVGLQATLTALSSFDTDGKPIEVSGKRMTSKGKQKKTSLPHME